MFDNSQSQFFIIENTPIKQQEKQASLKSQQTFQSVKRTKIKQRFARMQAFQSEEKTTEEDKSS